MAIISTDITDTLNTFRVNSNTVASNQGDLAALTTSATTDLVSAINEVNAATGGSGAVTEAFKTFAVTSTASGTPSGNSSVVADVAADTITFVEGQNIAIETDATTDEIQIAVATNSQFDGLYVGNGAASYAQDEIRAEGNITAFYSSDATLKININPLQNALEKVHSIRGVDFDWKEDVIKKRGGEDGYFVRKKDVGVIAQEIKEVLPEVVVERKDGTLAVRYEGIVPLLIEAIKELSEKIRILESK